MKKILICVASILTGITIGAISVGKIAGKEIKLIKANSERYLELFQMMNQWVKVKQNGKKLSEYLNRNSYNEIAIYGMGVAGYTLLDELRESEINVAYGIDKKADSLYADIDIFSMENTLNEVDAIIVTSITFFDEIKEQLEEKVNCPIISLEDILYEV